MVTKRSYPLNSANCIAYKLPGQEKKSKSVLTTFTPSFSFDSHITSSKIAKSIPTLEMRNDVTAALTLNPCFSNIVLPLVVIPQNSQINCLKTS